MPLKPIITCGDLNVAFNEIDVHNPRSKIDIAGFTNREREDMALLLRLGFIDAFRYIRPRARGEYTFWPYNKNARERNEGWRLDYFLVSYNLQDKIYSVAHRKEIEGSDHCPVVLYCKL